jgi:pantoate--beta-alanine ligase
MSITIVRTPADLKDITTQWRHEKIRSGFVPTMGALHEGHLSLTQIARAQADKTIVSIFVNPTQFAPHEDFSIYPRDEEKDVALLEAAGVDVVYIPGINDMYPIGAISDMKAGSAAKGLEGTLRPTHFDGVVTVVARLFKHCEPDVAVFGEKDYQQLCVIRQMTHYMDLPVDIIGAPIIRDAHGLALSSRNAYLSAKELAVARKLNVILSEAKDLIVSGKRDPSDARSAPERPQDDILKDAVQKLLAAGFDEVQYLEHRDAATLQSVNDFKRPARLLAAVKIAKTRLIDNVAV